MAISLGQGAQFIQKSLITPNTLFNALKGILASTTHVGWSYDSGERLYQQIVCLGWRQHLQQCWAPVLLLTSDRTADTVLHTLGRKKRVSDAMVDRDDTAEQARSKQVTAMLLAANRAKVGCQRSLLCKSSWVLTTQCWSSFCARRVDMGTKQLYVFLFSLVVLISTCRVASLYKQM